MTDTSTPDTYRRIYEAFDAPVSRFDCGRKCAPHNGGEPVCCSTQHAVPVATMAEWRLLKSRTNLWRIFKPYDASTRQIKESLHHSCRAIECKGFMSCERQNRTLACRAFPFFPYITADKSFIGLSYYWIFEDRCWIQSNLQVVGRPFVEEFVRAYEILFAEDREEHQAYVDQSAAMRRVFTRRRRPIPLIHRDGGYFKIMPRTHQLRPARAEDFPKHGPYRYGE